MKGQGRDELRNVVLQLGWWNNINLFKHKDTAENPGADPGILFRGGVKVAGRGPDQLTSETFILKSFFLQIWLLLDTLNLEF